MSVVGKGMLLRFLVGFLSKIYLKNKSFLVSGGKDIEDQIV